MRRKLVQLVSAIGITILIIGGVGMFLPTTWSAESSVTIKAPPATIHRLVSELSAWPSWVVWTVKSDPTLEVSFTGHGPGAIYRWRGSSMGRGMLRILESSVERGVVFEGAIDSEAINLKSSITYGAMSGGTRVMWKSEGDLGKRPIGGYFVDSLKQGTTRALELGLKNLKREAEAVAGTDTPPSPTR